jgi:2-iminoacetate synthase ThiH
MLQLFQKQLPNYPDKVVFVGHPMAAGMGITLHAAPTSVFYSNDFSPENRLQACARGHRLGMLPNGGLIIDLIHLESDQLVIDSLERSENLQSISMHAVLETFGGSNE